LDSEFCISYNFLGGKEDGEGVCGWVDQALLSLLLLLTSAVASTSFSLLLLPQVSDGLMGSCQGVLRGCGKQVLLMVYNFIVSTECI
jgi:hypothetical protein